VSWSVMKSRKTRGSQSWSSHSNRCSRRIAPSETAASVRADCTLTMPRHFAMARWRGQSAAPFGDGTFRIEVPPRCCSRCGHGRPNTGNSYHHSSGTGIQLASWRQDAICPSDTRGPRARGTRRCSRLNRSSPPRTFFDVGTTRRRMGQRASNRSVPYPKLALSRYRAVSGIRPSRAA
jgi:hypothetical protein